MVIFRFQGRILDFQGYEQSNISVKNGAGGGGDGGVGGNMGVGGGDGHPLPLEPPVGSVIEIGHSFTTWW